MHPDILRPVPSDPPRRWSSTPTAPSADRFIAELDEEYYQHYAGLKDRLELEEIYERHSTLTDARAGAGRRRGGRRRPPHPRALALRLRGLPRQPHARARREARRARGRARGDRRRRDRSRSACSGPRWRTSRIATARAARPRDVGGDRGAPEPDLPRRASRSSAASCPRSARRATSSSTSASASGSRSSPRSARRSSPTPSSSTRTRSTVPSREHCSGSRSTSLARWDVQRMIRSPQWDEGFPATRWCRR